MDRIWIILHRYRWVGWLMLVLPLAAVVWLAKDWPAWKATGETRPAELSDGARLIEFPETEAIPDYLWSALVPPKQKVVKAKRNVHEFYRFAGAVKYEGDGGVVFAQAILDDLKNKRQAMVAPGKSLNGELKVIEVLDDMAAVEFDGQRLNLSMRFAPTAAPAAQQEEGEEKGVPFWDRPALDQNRYGKMFAENRWVLQREKLMEYYQEVTQEPEQLLRLFDSFRPDRDAANQGKVKGYNLQFQGTQEFLSDMGLQEGDTVRKVNSMNMTSQRRAEWFISEFVRGNIDAFVLDVERGEETIQKVYIVR